MADCYYHGQSSPGSCGKCDRNIRAGRDAGDDGDYPKPTQKQPAFIPQNLKEKDNEQQ